MSYLNKRREVLIKVTDPAQFDFFKEIVEDEFGAIAICASDFEQLQELAEENKNWRLIVIVVAVPALSIGNITRLSQHFRRLGERQIMPPVCIVGPRQRTEWIGIQSPMAYLSLPPSELRGEMSGEARQKIVAELQQFFIKPPKDQTQPLLQPEAPSLWRDDPPDSEDSAIDQELASCLAEIKRLSESISDDRREIESLKHEKQERLTALDEEMGRYREYVEGCLGSDSTGSDTDPRG